MKDCNSPQKHMSNHFIHVVLWAQLETKSRRSRERNMDLPTWKRNMKFPSRTITTKRRSEEPSGNTPSAPKRGTPTQMTLPFLFLKGVYSPKKSCRTIEKKVGMNRKNHGELFFKCSASKKTKVLLSQNRLFFLPYFRSLL